LFSFYINNGFAGSPLKYSGYSGFNALLSGVNHFNRQWDFQNFATFFWSSTPYGPYKAWNHVMNDYNPCLPTRQASVLFYPSSRANDLSVRCVRDEYTPEAKLMSVFLKNTVSGEKYFSLDSKLESNLHRYMPIYQLF
jgi:hypothetical protein